MKEREMKLPKNFSDAELSINGAYVKASRKDGVLSLEGIRDEDLYDYLVFSEKFTKKSTALKAPPKPRTAKATPAAKPEPAVAQQSEPPKADANGAANGKVHHLPTPTELQAKKERADEQTKSDAEEAAAEASQPPAQFVEDLDVHQAVDRGKRVKEGEEDAPKELAEAKSLKEVLLYFHEHHKLASNDEMLEACTAWREQVPVLSRIESKSLKLRVTTTTDTLGLWKD